MTSPLYLAHCNYHHNLKCFQLLLYKTLFQNIWIEILKICTFGNPFISHCLPSTMMVMNQIMRRTVLGDPQPKRVIRQSGQFDFCHILMQNYSYSLVDKSDGQTCAGLETTAECCIHPLLIKARDETIERSHQASMAAENLQEDSPVHGFCADGRNLCQWTKQGKSCSCQSQRCRKSTCSC